MTSYIRFAVTSIMAFVLILAACGRRVDQPSSNQPIVLTGDYLGQTQPGSMPELFAVGVVSTGMGERDGAFSPDGNEFYYSISSSYFSAIIFLKRENDRWTSPEVAPFSGRYWDIEPALSPDGSRLYFASNRPRVQGEDSKDFDIWYVDRVDSGWSEPVHIEGPINSPANEFYPSITKDGTIYFTSTRKDSRGGEDIYRCRMVNGALGDPENLGNAVNSAKYEYNAFVAPDESYLIFTSFGRDDERGGGDLYISFRNSDGSWTPARNMGESVNSATIDYCPSVTPDGRFLFFTSKRAALRGPLETAITFAALTDSLTGIQNGLDNIYWINAAVIGQLKSQ